MSTEVEDMLKTLQDEDGPRTPDSFVFTDLDDEPFSESTLNRYFNDAKAIAGITRRFRQKDMRHTYGTLTLNAGANMTALQKSMGHTTSKMTEHYARFQIKTIQGLRSSIDLAFQRTPSSLT